jgi:hypothetical protein
MKEATKRSIFRWIHIIFAIPILGYIYSPFDQIPNYAFPTRFIFVPVMVAVSDGRRNTCLEFTRRSLKS